MRLLDDRATRLFIGLAAFFCVNAVLAEFIGVKIFALEDTLGIVPLQCRHRKGGSVCRNEVKSRNRLCLAHRQSEAVSGTVPKKRMRGWFNLTSARLVEALPNEIVPVCLSESIARRRDTVNGPALAISGHDAVPD